jgi:hypothetical protein
VSRGPWTCRLASAALAIALATPSVAHAERRGRRTRTPRPAAGVALSLAELGWPAETRSLALRDAAKVYARAGGRGGRLGKLAAGTRVAFNAAVAARGACTVWVELVPAGTGWICARGTTPSSEPPRATAHPIDRAPRDDFAEVTKTTEAYPSVDAIAAGTPSRTVRRASSVELTGRSETVDGVRYARTDQGLIAARHLAAAEPSAFAGVDLVAAPPPRWPFAWLYPKRAGGRIELLDRPGGAVVGRAEPRAIVPVLAETADHVQIAAGPDRWIRADDAHVARQTTAPTGVAADERWIDVDLDEQVLVAYDGATPAYATLISSGHHTSGTPVGVHRIRTKTARTTMRNPPGAALSWHVRDVPWAMGYRKNFALHGVYWHDAFGSKRSHGCVNLAPADARWMWGWTRPAVPDGWIEVKAADGAGTAIRIRNRYHPDPPWMDFEGKVR